MATTYREHILPIPRAFLALRALQLAVAIVVLGMCGYGINFYAYDGFCLSLFTALATMIIAVYVVVSELFLPIIYNYWAILGLDIFAIVFWFSSFILMAVEASRFHTVYFFDEIFFKRSLVKRNTNFHTYKGVMGATAGMGALEFLLFIGTLVLTGVHLHHHRKTGGHSLYRSTGVGAAPAGTTAPVAETKEAPIESELPVPEHNTAPTATAEATV